MPGSGPWFAFLGIVAIRFQLCTVQVGLLLLPTFPLGVLIDGDDAEGHLRHIDEFGTHPDDQRLPIVLAFPEIRSSVSDC